ncbi:MAG: flavodoxin domain-containing protein [Promicromonosporaceae bacterium]|nr:flavodoxin domain-containing protein [Promicromonosporaceae bacterium]
MKIAVVVASRHGTTAELAERIATELPDADVYELSVGFPDLAQYEGVIVGSATYAGKPLPAMREYALTADLTGKRLALFLGGMVESADEREKQFATAFPASWRERAVAEEWLGGRFDLSRLSFAERATVRVAAKVKENTEAIDDAAIERIVAAMRD